LLKTLVEAKPTLFFGVPRVYEKIREKMMEVAKSNSGHKHKFSWFLVPEAHIKRQATRNDCLPSLLEDRDK
jgi:long-subunit acyl-CoA synthetase (AMP-forming)